MRRFDAMSELPCPHDRLTIEIESKNEEYLFNILLSYSAIITPLV